MAADGLQGVSGQGQGGAAAAAGLDPLTPAFLLQLIKLLRRKQTLLDKAKQHNDAMTVSAKLERESVCVYILIVRCWLLFILYHL